MEFCRKVDKYNRKVEYTPVSAEALKSLLVFV